MGRFLILFEVTFRCDNCFRSAIDGQEIISIWFSPSSSDFSEFRQVLKAVIEIFEREFLVRSKNFRDFRPVKSGIEGERGGGEWFYA